MSKQVKSVRFDENLLKLFDDYSEFLKMTFGKRISFSSFVNEALAEYLCSSISFYLNAMHDESIVRQLPNGRLKRYEFTEEQLAKIDELDNEAGAVQGCMLQEKLDTKR